MHEDPRRRDQKHLVKCPDASEFVDPSKSRRVVGIGAVCDFGSATPKPNWTGSLSFSITEFVVLEDGRHVILTDDRGFSQSSVKELVVKENGQPLVAESAARASTGLTPESMREDVRIVAFADDDELGDGSHISELAEIATTRGIEVTVERLKMLTYEVFLTARLAEWLEAC